MAGFEEGVEAEEDGKDPRHATEEGEARSGEDVGSLEGEEDSYTSVNTEHADKEQGGYVHC